MTIGALAITMTDDLDKAGSAEVTIKKSTLGIVALVPAFLVLILQIGTPFIGFIRDDQAKKEQLTALQKTVEAMTIRQEAQGVLIQNISQSLLELKTQANTKGDK